MKKLLPILAFLLMYNAASAQNELTFGVFGNNGGVMFKHLLDNSTALRLYFSGNYTNTSDKLQPDIRNPDIAVAIGLGYEWRKDLGDNFKLLYGIDLNVNFENNKTKTSLNGVDFTNTRSTYGIGIAPFLGGYYSFSKRMFLLSEARFSVINYSSTKTYDIDSNTKDEHVTNNKSAFSLGFIPTYTVGVGFRF